MRLKTHTKVLLAAVILMVIGAAAWNLGIKNLVMGGGGDDAAVASTAPTPEPKKGVFGSLFSSAPTGPLGSKSNPLKVSLVSFHGYAPALVANGNSLLTKENSIFAGKGVHVEFLIQDDIPTLPTLFEADIAHCAWRTSDFWAQEHPALRGNNLDGRAVMIVDNTRGADAIIARDPNVQSVEDLVGQSVGLLQFTPSDGFFIDALDNSSLSGRKKQQIMDKVVYVNADEGTPGVRAAFEAGQVDAAVLWDPDLSLALQAVPGAHRVYDTSTATNLIYDVIVCDAEHLDNPANMEIFQAFVAGWMEGVEVAEKDPDAAVEALVATEEFFTLLAQDQGKPFVRSLFDNLVWTGLEENARILGRAGDQNHFERVYAKFDGIYRAAGYIANPNAPVINPKDAFDYRFIDSLLAQDKSVAAAAAKPEFTFSEEEREKVVASTSAALTKAVQINFSTGSAELSKRSTQTIDNEVIPLIDSMGNAYFEISGNTDSTGSRAGNMALSKRRADAVVEYLVSEWEVPHERLKVVGNGPDKPLCNEADPAAEGLDLEQCRALNRTTRVAVLSR